ncbi:hypothetical protein BFC20_10630 [Brochothrix thermosphacta]|uniref:hypothetical protein n=1 Tax=Brochothrix thermosphacta TaxID=2756 RepID=UPI000E760D00|nr:hypothetical protein [Brochothrix thermosphacta]ANZ98127.1 hypothetical protein BFC20_10630 [Brochothrix thermosphacta]
MTVFWSICIGFVFGAIFIGLERKTNNVDEKARKHKRNNENFTRVRVKKPIELKPSTALFVEGFRNVQSDLKVRYEKSAKSLLGDERLFESTYQRGDSVFIEIPNDLIRKHFKNHLFYNKEHCNQLKLAFKKLDITATDMQDESRFGDCIYSDDEFRRTMLMVEVTRKDIVYREAYSNNKPYYIER